ncbi:MAG: hypothetical protein AABY46_04425, partial [Nitrospirota bacterium]
SSDPAVLVWSSAVPSAYPAPDLLQGSGRSEPINGRTAVLGGGAPFARRESLSAGGAGRALRN